MPDPLPMPSPWPEIPPDHAERSRALDPTRSFLVQAPAGSGKTYLLTQRFLRLLAEAEKPDEIVAITFTNAAAAEMRNRVLEALEHAELGDATENGPESLTALAARAMQHAKLRGWQILDQPGLLRITTIDAFCRGLALQCPLNWGLLSSLGGRLETVEKAEALYKQAASRTLAQLGGEDSPTRQAIEQLLLWRDNNWLEVEELIVDMLGKRNRWYQEFVFARDGDWDALRARLEGAFCRGARSRLETLRRLMDGLPGCGEFALELARAACESPGTQSPFSLAERAELPAFFPEANDAESKFLLEDAVTAYRDLANFLMSLAGSWRKRGGLTERQGFPATTAGRQAKDRFVQYVEGLAQEPGLEAALAAFQKAVPVRYSEEEWELVKSCFAVLRAAAGELLELFAEAGAVDFTEVSQIALQVLIADDGSPSDFALRQADGIRHLLMDEFQDTSRNQHQLLSRLIGAWPDHAARSCFCVGDPMQSIYSFRDAEVELFERLKTNGLDIASDPEPYRFEFVALRANFRTVPTLVNDLNGHFGQIFAEDDGSGVRFAPAEAARKSASNAITELHLAFSQSTRTSAANRVPFGDPEETKKMQLQEMVALIQSKLAYLPAKRLASEKYRIAVLGRTRKSLIPVAEALSAAGIGYRAVDLVQLKERSEVLDALALARALLNPVDRTAWLGVLRAPWCGLSLAELHLICGADDEQIQATPIPLLLESRLPQLHATGQLDELAYRAASRVSRVLRSSVDRRSTAAASTLGTWLESVWIALGGQETVNLEQSENLRLLWSAFDGLPEGELDIFGAALTAALDDLFALPDPEASSTLGVQLMTIHKSKGLEFEIVLIAELQAESAKSERGMVSWLERGLSESEGERELTEFLIAPIQTKGGEAGEAKAWVDGVKRAREQQELRRLLYVAATRAREELHLFARPGFTAKRPDMKALASGPILELAKPTGLLATAWPAVGDAIEARFNAWKHELKEEDNQKDAVLGAIAAQAGTVVAIPNQEDQPSQEGRPTRMRRLPRDYVGPEYPRRSLSVPSSLSDAGDESEDDPAQSDLYARTEGGLRSRLEGKAIHTLLEQLSLLRLTLAPEAAVRELATSLARIAASMRSEGLTLPTARRLAESAIAVASRAALHPVGGWILAPHAEAQSEARWTGLVHSELTQDGRLQQRNLRPDRVFLAAPATLSVAVESDSPDAPVWWIIDYKSSHAGEANLAVDAEKVAFLATHRELYRGQLAVYAHMLRALRAPDTTRIRTGIYYTRLGLFDSWPA